MVHEFGIWGVCMRVKRASLRVGVLLEQHQRTSLNTNNRWCVGSSRRRFSAKIKSSRKSSVVVRPVFLPWLNFVNFAYVTVIRVWIWDQSGHPRVAAPAFRPPIYRPCLWSSNTNTHGLEYLLMLCESKATSVEELRCHIKNAVIL